MERYTPALSRTDEVERRDRPKSGARALVCAILREAYDNATITRRLGYSVRAARIERAAQAWFCSDLDHYPEPLRGFTFRGCCAVLGLDPQWFRRRLFSGQGKLRARYTRAHDPTD